MDPQTNSQQTDMRGLLMLLAAIVMAGAQLSFEIPLVVRITGFYKISDSDFGLLLGLTTFVMAVSNAPFGYLADKFSRIRLILISQAILTLSLLLSGACMLLDLPYPVFFAVKLLCGVGLGGIGPVATSAVIDTVRLEKRGAAFGWVGVAWVMGGAAGILLPALCVHLQLSLGLTYLVCGLIALLFTLSLLLVDEPRRGSQDRELQELVGAGKAEYDRRIRAADLKSLLLKPANLLLVAAMLLFQLPQQVLSVWFVTFLVRNHGLTEMISSQVMMVAFIGMPFGNALGGSWTDRAFKKKRTGRTRVMTVLALFTPVFLVAAMVAPFKWVIFMPLMVLANFFVVASGPGLTTVSLEVNLPEHRGTVSALLALFANLSRAVAWYLPPMIAAAFGGRYDRAFMITAAASLPLAGIYLMMTLRIEKDLDLVAGTLKDRAREFKA